MINNQMGQMGGMGGMGGGFGQGGFGSGGFAQPGQARPGFGQPGMANPNPGFGVQPQVDNTQAFQNVFSNLNNPQAQPNTNTTGTQPVQGQSGQPQMPQMNNPFGMPQQPMQYGQMPMYNPNPMMNQNPMMFQQPQPVQNPEETYKSQLEQLEQMGFVNKELNIQVLNQTQGNVNAAVERLLNMMGWFFLNYIYVKWKISLRY